MVGKPLPTSLAGADLKTIADQFGHSSIVLTADTYLSVAIELGLAVAAATARLILRHGKRPPGSGHTRCPATGHRHRPCSMPEPPRRLPRMRLATVRSPTS